MPIKIAVIFLLVSFIHPVFSQSEKPFSSLGFDKLVMYDFNSHPDGGDIYIANANGKLSTDILKQIEMTEEELKSFHAKLENKKSYGETTEACFDPHLGFVYYLKGTIVAHITVDLACNRLHASIDIPAQKQGKVSVGADTYYTATGLSKSFKTFINDLLVKYQFSHQLN